MPDVFVAPSTSLPQEEEPTALPAQAVLPQKSPAPFAALMVNPTRVYFQNQDQDEQIILLLRKHWVTNLGWVITSFLMLLLPPFLAVFVPLLNLPLEISPSTLWLGQIFWYLVTFGYLFINFLIWYFNAHLVTNKRVVDIDFHNLTYKDVAATRIELIQDVTFKVGGVIRNIFDYGDVFVQTAGTEPNFEFQAVPKPAFVADKISDLMAVERGGTP